MLMFLVQMAVMAAMYGAACYGIMKVFEKVGGIPTWAAFVPFYNLFLLTTEVAKKDVIWVAIALIPVVGGVLISLEVAKKYGKSQNFGIGLGLLPFVFYPMLGTGDAEYNADAAEAVKAKAW
jgi:hypothetical protein